MSSLEYLVKGILKIAKKLKRKQAVSQEREVTVKDQIMRTQPGSQREQGKKLTCVFAHYDKNNRAADYVLHYLRELNRLGFDTYFVTTSGPLLNEGEVAPLCKSLTYRKNVTIDWGSWKTGVSLADLAQSELLLLVNDSVYGPVFPLEEVLEKMKAGAYDVWGITDSWEHQYHLQSYFLGFSKNALQSEYFKNFWNGFRFATDKNWIIQNYEIGFVQGAIRAGLKVGSYVEYRSLKKGTVEPEKPTLLLGTERTNTLPLNPTLYFWKPLIEEYRCPFIKGELLKRNPLHSNELVAWEDVVRKHTDYNPNLIIEHLKYNSINTSV